MKKAFTIFNLLKFSILLLAFGFTESIAQNSVYSESFVSGSSYCQGTPQYDNWVTFRSSLDTSTKKFIQAKIFGNNDPNGQTLSDPIKVRQLAEALRQGFNFSITDNGFTWQVGTGCGSCGNSSHVVELAVYPTGSGNTCQCLAGPNQYSIRVAIGNSNWGGIGSANCPPPSQTMSLVFFNPVNNDVGISSILNPSSACGSANDSVEVVLNNFGINKIAGVDIKVQVTGTLGGNPVNTILTRSYSDSINPDNSVVLKVGPGINTALGADIKFKAWAELSSDTTHSNDTVNVDYANAGTPSANANPTGAERCGSGTLTLNGGIPSLHTGFWYDAPTGGNLLALGNNFVTPIIPGGTNRNFYVVAGKVSPQRIIGTTFNGPYAPNGGNPGFMFDFTTNKAIVIDSFAIHISNNFSQNIRVYVTQGGYAGKQFNANSWQLVSSTTVVGRGANQPTFVRINPLEVPPGTYGVYIVTEGGLRMSLGSTSGNDKVVSLAGGYALNELFANQYCCNYAWDGRIYYKITCNTGNRTAVNALARQIPGGSDFVRGTTYNGRFNSGNLANPDVVAEGDQITYNINNPTGFSNTQYGSVWDISSFTFVSSGGVPVPNSMYTYTQPSSSGIGGLSFTPNVSWTDSTVIATAKLRFIATNCDSTISRIIFIAPRPVPGGSGTNACLGESSIFTNTSTISSGSMSYIWDFGDGDSSTLINPIHKYSNPGTYQVKLYAISNYEYVEMTQFFVDVFEIPTANFTYVNACEGTPISYSSTSTLPAGNPTYEWFYGDNSAVGSGANSNHSFVPGVYQTRLKVTVNGCSDDISKYVTQAPRANVAFTNSAVTCDNLKIDFTNNTTVDFGTLGYTWKFGDGKQSSAINPSHNYDNFATYTIVLIANTGFGCIDSVSKIITPIESPKADFNLVANACTRDIISLNNLTSVPANTTMTYAWELGDGNVSNQTNLTHQYLLPGTYTAKLTAVASNGCFSSKELDINIALKPLAGFIANDVCEGAQTSFSNVSDGFGQNVSYFWTFGDGNASSDATPNITYDDPGAYRVVLRVSNNVCFDTMEKMINVYPNPVLNPSVTTANLGNGSMQFNSNATGAVSFIWFFGDGGTSTQENPLYRYIGDNIYTATVRATSANGCVSTEQVEARVSRLSTSNVDANGKIKLYPNPNNGRFEVFVDTQNEVQISILNLLGQEMNAQINHEGENHFKVNMNDLPAGVYLVRVVENDKVNLIKVTVNR